MDVDLIGYLVNALDPEERGRTDAYLREHPEARKKLQSLKAGLAPLEVLRAAPQPPARLVERTLARALGASPVTLVSERNYSPSRWRRIDALVACGILIVVGGLGTSGVARLHHQHRIAGCQNNMRQYHQALTGYAAMRDGALPFVADQPPRNFASAFVPMLVEAGQLTTAGPDCPAVVSPKESPAYAYSLGYRDPDGQLRGLRRDGGSDWDLLPILADREQPASHRGGHNVLYIGGAVRYCISPNVGVGGDNIFLNQANRVAAGLHRVDTAMADGHTTP